MKFLISIAILFSASIAFSNEVTIGCSTASYGCVKEDICGWIQDGINPDNYWKTMTLTQDPEDPSTWMATTSEEIKGFQVTNRIYVAIKGESKTYYNRVELKKDTAIAETSYQKHVEVSLRVGGSSLAYNCSIK